MTLKDLLENGYGIDFDTLTFKTNGIACTIEEIKDSMANNELSIGNDEYIFDVDDFDIDDDYKKTTLYMA